MRRAIQRHQTKFWSTQRETISLLLIVVYLWHVEWAYFHYILMDKTWAQDVEGESEHCRTFIQMLIFIGSSRNGRTLFLQMKFEILENCLDEEETVYIHSPHTIDDEIILSQVA